MGIAWARGRSSDRRGRNRRRITYSVCNGAATTSPDIDSDQRHLAEQRDMVARIEQICPLWLIMYGPWSRKFWAFSRFSVDNQGVMVSSPDLLALAAERSEHIGLGPGVLVPALRHPMVNASGAAALAALAPGRVAVAFGTGIAGARAMGANPAHGISPRLRPAGGRTSADTSWPRCAPRPGLTQELALSALSCGPGRNRGLGESASAQPTASNPGCGGSGTIGIYSRASIAWASRSKST
jgi:hypothetical protein